jgi:protoporphyrinogen/coproporphyrinogen III oxidase
VNRFDVAVIGGGIAGLSAAYELSRRGRSVVVLERDERPGGVILSEQVDGFTIDAGPDALLIQKPDGIRLCEEIGLGDRLVATRPPRLAYIQRGGRLHPLPAGSVLGIPTSWGPFARTALFSWRGKARMAAELFVPAKRDAADESIGAFMTRRFGREATDYLAEPLLAGIHAGDVDRLSVRSLFPRFVNLEQRHGSLLRAFRAAPRQVANDEGAFRSLPGGLTEMVCALVDAIGASGRSTVRIRTAATAIGGAGSFAVRTDGGEPVEACAVVYATPAYVTASLVREADPELARACDEIAYASVATVALGFRRDAVAHPLNGSGFVVPRLERTGILAASWMSSKWPHRAPDDLVLIRTFVGGARDPLALDDSDEELVERSLDALRPLLRITADPLLARVYRWERASAQHEVGHDARVAAIERGLMRHPGWFITGSGFRAIGIPDCVADGRATGAQVDDFLKAGSNTEERGRPR